MIVYYAPGGGLGHVSRAVKVLTKFKINNATILVSPHLKNSPYLDKVSGGYTICFLPETSSTEALASWLNLQFERLLPEYLFVDSFPAGILGELSLVKLENTRCILIARLLNWPVYVKRVTTLIHFWQTWFCEWPTAIQETAMSGYTGEMAWLNLTVTNSNQAAQKNVVVCHSGSSSEIIQLVKYAQSLTGELPDLISPHLPSELPAIHWRHIYPATPELLHYKVIVSGAGFNAFTEMMHCRNVHFVPFERVLDLQSLRSQRGKQGLVPPANLPVAQFSIE